MAGWLFWCGVIPLLFCVPISLLTVRMFARARKRWRVDVDGHVLEVRNSGLAEELWIDGALCARTRHLVAMRSELRGTFEHAGAPREVLVELRQVPVGRMSIGRKIEVGVRVDGVEQEATELV